MSMLRQIPLVLHQTWRTTALPSEFARFRDSWRRHHPAWQHRFYDDEACRREVAQMGAPWPGVYARLPTGIQRADLFRYLIVFRHGGVYADVDMECRRPVDALLEGASCVLAIEAHLTERRRRRLGYRAPRQIANCVFAARPGDPFLARVLDRIGAAGTSDVRTDDDIEDSTGPRLLTRVFESLPPQEAGQIRLLPQISLVPPSVPRLVEWWLAPYARHHFAGTWKRDPVSGRSLWRRWLERDRVPPLGRAPDGSTWDEA